MHCKCEENKCKLFGGKVIVLGGNFGQILLIVRKGLKQDILKATINSLDLWKHCKVLKLTKNMRLTTAKSNQIANEIKNFVDWILQLGNGDIDSNEKGEGDIEIPTDLLVLDNDKPLVSLVDFVYSNILENLSVPNFFEERGILAPTLEIVEEVNEFMLSLIPGMKNSI